MERIAEPRKTRPGRKNKDVFSAVGRPLLLYNYCDFMGISAKHDAGKVAFEGGIGYTEFTGEGAF